MALCTLPGVCVCIINYTAVVQPVITSTFAGNAGAPQFIINTDSFSDSYGRVGVYKVVVVRGNRVEPSDIPDSQLTPADSSQFKYVSYINTERS